MTNHAASVFAARYGAGIRPVLYVSPGRVNLIGEHIDYNGGSVFPAALSLGNEGAFARREDHVLRLFSANVPETGVVTVDLAHLAYRKEDGWANYAKGVVLALSRRGNIDHGFDAAVEGDLPQASGLSSSASIELLFAAYVNDAYGIGLSRPELAVLCKQVENDYIGVNCGIMDQFVIANGKADHALLLDCATLAYEAIPLPLSDHAIVIVNSRVKRGLVDSKYNERRRECDAALAILRRSRPIDQLCDLDGKTFATLAGTLTEDVLLRRARHAVTENERTRLAAASLRRGDLVAFGQAMDASHASLRDDYEVSIPELDTLVVLAKEAGALGARMTGAGFGGCIVAIVPTAGIPEFRATVTRGYLAAYNREPAIYVAKSSDGVRRIG